MRQGIWRSSPALVISALALFTALGGSVYAAKKTRVDGKTIRVKSIPGNRLKPRSIAANRLKPGVLPTTTPVTTPLTGAEINELTLGKVPTAAHADEASEAAHAVVADSAVNALNAQTVNGHSAGCLPSTLLFAGACWDSSASNSATAPMAAARCAERGGSLPEALQLAALAEQPGVALDDGDEWTSDIPVFSGLNTYGVATVSALGQINSSVSTLPHAYRCVIPLLR